MSWLIFEASSVAVVLDFDDGIVRNSPRCQDPFWVAELIRRRLSANRSSSLRANSSKILGSFSKMIRLQRAFISACSSRITESDFQETVSELNFENIRSLAVTAPLGLIRTLAHLVFRGCGLFVSRIKSMPASVPYLSARPSNSRDLAWLAQCRAPKTTGARHRLWHRMPRVFPRVRNHRGGRPSSA